MIDQMKYKKECALCETKIWELHEGKLRKSDEYKEVVVELNSLSKMTVGVCKQHERPTKVQLPLIMEKVHKGWAEEVAFGIGNESWVKDVGMKLIAMRYAR